MAVRAVDREELQRLLQRGAQLVEVLPRNEYEDEHLPGAINVPLRELDDRAEDLLRRDRPIVVYCWDSA
jgi:phage shock protein E